jgi:hypothetical protein
LERSFSIVPGEFLEPLYEKGLFKIKAMVQKGKTLPFSNWQFPNWQLSKEIGSTLKGSLLKGEFF